MPPHDTKYNEASMIYAADIKNEGKLPNKVINILSPDEVTILYMQCLALVIYISTIRKSTKGQKNACQCPARTSESIGDTKKKQASKKKGVLAIMNDQ